MVSQLQARLLHYVLSPKGPQADLILAESNGDEHQVRCLCLSDGTTELGGEGEVLSYLNERYGEAIVSSLSRQITLTR